MDLPVIFNRGKTIEGNILIRLSSFNVHAKCSFQQRNPLEIQVTNNAFT